MLDKLDIEKYHWICTLERIQNSGEDLGELINKDELHQLITWKNGFERLYKE